jgi:hypothetical protein
MTFRQAIEAITLATLTLLELDIDKRSHRTLLETALSVKIEF